MIVDFSPEQLQHWASQYEVFCALQSHQYPDAYGKYETLWAVGIESECIGYEGSSLEEIDTFKHQNWCFGFLSYDIKNMLYPNLQMHHEEQLNFPLFYFFKPKFVLCEHKDATWELLKGNQIEFEQEIKSVLPNCKPNAAEDFDIQSRLTASQYIEKVEKLQEHIRRGDIYEVNFCQEFFVENTSFSAFELYHHLNKISPKPFSSFFKYKHQYIIGASPERFLTKIGEKLYAQPIKGTVASSHHLSENETLKAQLLHSEKERSENVMIVDLMRNDLTQIAKKKSVKVEELFGIYTFAQVNQMISTISCTLEENISFTSILKATFPMGSMTGAPKLRAMELIDAYEASNRGVYSGSIGYFTPHGDFDFNVVIRSVLYHEIQQYLSFQVGSAITFLSDAAQEYEECLLKAKAIYTVLETIRRTS